MGWTPWLQRIAELGCSRNVASTDVRYPSAFPGVGSTAYVEEKRVKPSVKSLEAEEDNLTTKKKTWSHQVDISTDKSALRG